MTDTQSELLKRRDLPQLNLSAKLYRVRSYSTHVSSIYASPIGSCHCTTSMERSSVKQPHTGSRLYVYNYGNEACSESHRVRNKSLVFVFYRLTICFYFFTRIRRAMLFTVNARMLESSALAQNLDENFLLHSRYINILQFTIMFTTENEIAHCLLNGGV